MFNKNKKKDEKDSGNDKKIEATKNKENLKKTSKKGESYRFLISPLLTEKGTIAREEGKYFFKASESANKIEIKKAVENIFGVKVKDVNVVNIPRKKRRFGRNQGFKAGYKKAIVTLVKGEKIEEI